MTTTASPSSPGEGITWEVGTTVLAVATHERRGIDVEIGQATLTEIGRGWVKVRSGNSKINAAKIDRKDGSSARSSWGWTVTLWASQEAYEAGQERVRRVDQINEWRHSYSWERDMTPDAIDRLHALLADAGAITPGEAL